MKNYKHRYLIKGAGHVSRLTFIRYAHRQEIGKPSNYFRKMPFTPN